MLGAPNPLMAYWAGVAAFIAPCTLVLVPFFLLFVAGVAVLQGRYRRNLRLKTIGLWFALGFIPAFVLVWSFPNSIEAIVRWSRALERVGGAVLLAYGLGVLGIVFLTGFFGAARHDLGNAMAILTGATLAVGWTPCVGNTLSRILGMTGGPESLTASLLLVIYALGLMTPFAALGLALAWPAGRLRRASWRRWAAPLAGAGLVVVGLVVLTGNMRDLTAYFFALAPGLAV